jgi:ATP adenylyltransferase
MPDMTADRLQATYQERCDRRGLGSPDQDPRPRHPYNLLFCNSWMAVISRACDGVHGFSINALGFAGYLLSTDESDQDWLKRQGPESLLRGVVPLIP